MSSPEKRTPPAATAPVPGEPTYDPHGVDVTLIRWMLGLSPTERLEVLQRQVVALLELQRAAGAR